MSFWGNDRWVLANSRRQIVSDFSTDFLKDGCYKLSIGAEAIVSSGYAQNEDSYRELAAKKTFPLQPGQFAYLITNETITMPEGAIGFINVDTKTKIKGLINVSGFHVDPGYKGKLIFTVFNASPSSISLHAGQRIFRLWLSDFDGQGGQSNTHYDSLPRELEDRLHGTYPSPFALAARLDTLEGRVDELRVQRNLLLITVAVMTFLLLPFAAGLYASTYATWFGAKLGENLDTTSRAAKPPTAAQQTPAPPTPAPNTQGTKPP